MARDDEHWERVAELAELEYDERSKTVVSVNRNRQTGHLNIDVRVFWKQRETGIWHPSRRGITLGLGDWATAVAVIQVWLDEYYDSES